MSDEPIHDLEQQRRDNREKASALGLLAYGERRDGLVDLAEAARRYDGAADEDHKANGKSEGFEDRRPVVRAAGARRAAP